MAPYSQEINAAFADATVALVEGETLQAKAVKEQTFTRQVYFEVIGLKTAELFRAATKLGAILAGADAKTVEAMGNYGYDVGMAFQIVDDILDLVGDEATLGKTSGIDAEQGRGLSQISPDDGDPMAIIKQKVMNRDTIDEGRMMAQRFVDNALEGLEVLGDSPAKQALQEIAYTVIDRDH